MLGRLPQRATSLNGTALTATHYKVVPYSLAATHYKVVPYSLAATHYKVVPYSLAATHYIAGLRHFLFIGTYQTS